MKKKLIIAGIGICAVLLLPIFLIVSIYAAVSKEFRLKLLYRSMLLKEWILGNMEPLPVPEPFGLVADKLSEVKASTFIKCAVHEDYRSLILDGEATDERLADAWASILSEYYDKAGGKKSKQFLDLHKKIAKLALRINHIHTLCEQFELQYDDVFKPIFKGYGYNFPFTVSSYINDIARIRTMEKRYISMHTQLTIQLSKEFKYTEGKRTEADYYNTIEELRKHGNYQHDAITLADKWTMDTYCFLLTRYNEYMTKLNEQASIKNREK